MLNKRIILSSALLVCSLGLSAMDYVELQKMSRDITLLQKDFQRLTQIEREKVLLCALQRDAGDTREIVAFLLKNKVDPNVRLDMRVSPLCEACQNNLDPQYIRMLVHAGARLEIAKGYSSDNPLFAAIRGKCCENVKTLLELGVDVNQYNWAKVTALACAMHERATTCIDMLFRHGADPIMLQGVEKPTSCFKYACEHAQKREPRSLDCILRAGFHARWGIDLDAADRSIIEERFRTFRKSFKKDGTAEDNAGIGLYADDRDCLLEEAVYDLLRALSEQSLPQVQSFRQVAALREQGKVPSLCSFVLSRQLHGKK